MRLQRAGVDSDAAARAEAEAAARDDEADATVVEVRRLERLLLEKLDAKAKDDSDTARANVLMRLFRYNTGRPRSDRFATRAEFVEVMVQLGLGATPADIRGAGAVLFSKPKGAGGAAVAGEGRPLDALFEKHAEKRGKKDDEHELVDMEAFYKSVARNVSRPGQRSVAASEAAYYMMNVERVLEARQRPVGAGAAAAVTFKPIEIKKKGEEDEEDEESKAEAAERRRQRDAEVRAAASVGRVAAYY